MPRTHVVRGAGVTARIVVDGVRLRPHTAYLQSSPMCFGVYERLGFRAIETWACHCPA